MKIRVKGKEIKGLSSSVIYGPNAAGKTNIIGAMDVFRAIVLKGNIRNSEEKNSPNPASAALELIPNSNETEARPVYFLVDFYEEDKENRFRIQYELEIDIGTFLDVDYARRIVSETLMVNGECIFQRRDNLMLGNMKTIKKYLSEVAEQDPDKMLEIAKSSLSEEELFLTNGFRLIFSPIFTKLVLDWFTEKFMVIYRADSMQLIKRFSDPQKRTIYVEKTTDKAAKIFGINSNAVGYAIKEDESDAKLYSIFQNLKDKKTQRLHLKFLSHMERFVLSICFRLLSEQC